MATSPTEAAIHSSDCPAALTRGGVTPEAAAGFAWDRIPVPAALSLTVQRRLNKPWPHKLTCHAREPAGRKRRLVIWA